MVASISLDWMSKLMDKLGGRPGLSAALVDAMASSLPHRRTGEPDRQIARRRAADLGHRGDRTQFGQGPGLAVVPRGEWITARAELCSIAGTGSRLIASIDEDQVTATINGDIRTAYLQLAFVILFVLLGALIAAEKLIIKPIDMMAAMAKRSGQGNSSARVAHNRLPAEFVPLARAFNAMAAQLGQRERELVATNDQLTVIASIDMLSGLANRRGFQSRLDFEWMKAEQDDCALSLLMIDVDHFKLYNDTYGHPEGDACLTRLGETLSSIAAETMGFAGRYGGEEFCLLLPNVEAERAREIGEAVRSTVLALALPHQTSSHQFVTVSVGVASTKPGDTQRPGDLIEAADAALYAAKHRGRNTVVEHGFVRVTDGGDGVAMAS